MQLWMWMQLSHPSFHILIIQNRQRRWSHDGLEIMHAPPFAATTLVRKSTVKSEIHIIYSSSTWYMIFRKLNNDQFMFGLQFYLINVYHPQTLYSLERNQKTAWKNKIHEFVQIIVYISKCKRKYTAKYADGIIPISP